MEKFAFIVHLLEIGDIERKYKIFRYLPKWAGKKILNFLPPFHLAATEEIKSPYSATIGDIYVCPITKEELLNSPQAALKKISKTAQLAEARGAKLIGLGGLMAKENIARNVSKAVNVPVTAGKSYKTAAALESLKSNFAAAGFREKNVLILGAKEEGGAASAWYLADELKHLTLADHDERQARNLAKKIYDETGMAALAAADIKAAVKNADIIIAAEKIGEGFELKKGAVICDLAQSHSLAHLKKERDIFLSGGGLVKLPHCTALGFDFGFPKGCVSPKLAETIVLSLEKKSAPFAVGEKLTAAKLREIKSIAEKHGFSLYPSPLKKMADESKRDFRVTLEKSHEIN